MTSKFGTLLAACFLSCWIVPALSLLSCSVNVNRGLSDVHPLLLRDNRDEFFYPKKCNSERIKLLFCNALRVACTGGDLQVYGRNLNRAETDLKCYGVNVFRVGQDFLAAPLRNVTCPSAPTAQLTRTGLNCPNGVTARIGFPLQNGRWASTVESICHDENLDSTNWLHHKLPGAIRNRQLPIETPEFVTGPFYDNTVMSSSLFSRDSQRARLLALTNDQPTVDRVIPATSSNFLVPGMLAPADDMFYREQQKSTYYYVNTVPVWTSIRDGNWKQVENAVREIASRNCRTLDVYSGGFDSLMYNDNMGNPVSFTLTTTTATTPGPAVTVPRYLFKYVVDRVKNQALIFVTINDPAVTSPPPASDLLCPEHTPCSDRYPEFKTPLRGYTYCCTANQGSGIATRLANLGVPAFPNAQALSFSSQEATDSWAPVINDIFSNLISGRDEPAETLSSAEDDY